MTTLIKSAQPGTGPVRPTALRTAAPGRDHRRTAYRLLFVLASLLLWELAVRSGALPAGSVPRATTTASALASMVTTTAFWQAVGQTATGWGIGLLICAGVAIPAGLLVGTSRFLTRSTRLLIDFLRTIPAVALIPVLLLTLGSTMTMKVVLVVFGSVWPLLTATVDGVRHVDPVAADTVRTFRLSPLDRALRLVLPTALPFVVTGFRISAVLALMLTTAAEYLGAAPGVGKSLGTAQQAGAVDVMFAWLVVAGLLGTALNLVLLAAERGVLPWAPAQREAVR